MIERWRGKGINYSSVVLIKRISGGNAMTQMWTGDSAYGEKYIIEFKHKDESQVVDVFELTDARQKGAAIESRELPLSRQAALEFVEQYLTDLKPEEKEIVVERLCMDSDAFRVADSAL
jgi:hypothetical protein